MKQLLFLLLSAFPLCAAAQAEKLPVISSGSLRADLKIDGFMNKGGWIIMPQVSPDVYDVPSSKPVREVIFYTDSDSIRYEVREGDVFRFYILVNGRDSALTEIRGIKWTKPASYSDDYVRANRGKWFVEVPEVQELVHILMAITPTGIKDKNMVEHKGGYYKEVMERFLPYASEPVVAVLDSMLQRDFYPRLKMNSCCFEFDGDRIVQSKVYDRMAWGDAENNIRQFIPALEDIARKSRFREFYREHRPYYDSLKALTMKYMPVDKQWQWCESRFDRKYDSYRIYFSPLVNGSHSTNRMEDNGFSETLMYICPAFTGTTWNPNVTEGLNTRIVFTEIDHNYVNPVSDGYMDRIDAIFSDRNKWTSGDKDAPHYTNPYSVFNEYMTWAVFTLYAYDTFPEEDFRAINEYTEKLISDGRGFIRFAEFNRKMLELYKNSPDKKIEPLYPAMLDWSASLK